MICSTFLTICCYSVCAVARIALVKPEKARGVEDVILNAAQRGQIAEKVHEINLVSRCDILHGTPW
jgi:DNA-binding TFAR19-related protein (PDSD5 family)